MATERETSRQLDRELSDMMAQLSSRLGQLREAQDHNNNEDEDNGVRIITLAGTNTGSTLKSELGDQPSWRHHQGFKPAGAGEQGHEDVEDQEEDEMGTLVNSNFQAVNNSIMLSGSFTSNDPGVRVEISCGGGDPPPPHRTRRHGRHKLHQAHEVESGRTQSKAI